MNTRLLRATLPEAVLLSITALLPAACSRPSSPAQPAATAPAAAAKKTQDVVIAIARGQLDVEGGLVALRPAQDGVYASVNVRPGQQVQRGELLAELETRTARQELQLAQVGRRQAEAALQALQVRLPLTRRDAERWQAAAQAGVAEQQRADAAGQDSAQLESDIAVARAAVALAGQQIALAQARLEEHSLRSPVAAEVVSVLVQAGSHSQGSAADFLLLPQRPRIVRAELNESYSPRVRPGMPALVTVEALAAAPPLPARVLRLSPVLGRTRLQDEAQITRSVECILAFEPAATAAAEKLRIGQNLLVKFHD